MRCADLCKVLLCAALLALGGCGGGNSSVTTVVGGTGAGVVALDTPTGPNTTEIVVDSGPASGFSAGATNVAYVTVTVCAPGSATACTTIDHVALDTGSYGLRLFKSAVGRLGLPPITLPADPVAGTPAGTAVECYPFVLGALWGPLARADLQIQGELAGSLPIQVIDDGNPPGYAAPAGCGSVATGGLLNSVSALQANGVLGVGMVAYDCGQACAAGNYASGNLYYVCPDPAGTACVAAAIPIAQQVQNPVAHFPVDNNGTVIALPALPDLGAAAVRGRLVFGIGTQSNNQIPVGAQMYFVDPNPAHASYLSLTTAVDGGSYGDSYIDSGSNAYFFDDPTIPLGCKSSGGVTSGGWYCPPAVRPFTATLTDAYGASGPVAFSVANADALFGTSSVAFANLAGAVNQGSGTFVWGLPFFYGRTVMTSIWGQPLSPNGPWNAF